MEYEVTVGLGCGPRARRILEEAGYDVDGPFRGCTIETLFVLNASPDDDVQLLLWEHGFGYARVDRVG